VIEATVITTQPKSVSVHAGGTAKFSVGATGANLTYQWQCRNAGVSAWTTLKTTSPTLTAANVPESIYGRQYRCIVTGDGGSVISDIATLIVKPAVSITTQPKSVTVSAGGTAKFTIAATGSSLTYQWQCRNADVSAWTTLKTATATLTVSNVPESINGRQYRCIVKSGDTSVTSSVVTLTVTSGSVTKITTQPKSQTAGAGSTVKFTVAATGNNLSYQWQCRNAGVSAWTTLKTATATLTVSNVPASISGRQYRCTVKGTNGSVISNIATLTVVAATKITTQPKSATVKAGGTATFTIAATGKNLKYQWQCAESGTTKWVNLKTATPKLTVSKVPVSIDGRKYRCIVTGDGGSVTSNVVLLHVR
jgi:uncharacterized protein (DUF736 family)